MHVHSAINSSQKVQTIQMSISAWMDKQIVIYTHTHVYIYVYTCIHMHIHRPTQYGILLSHEKEWSIDTYYSVDEPQKHCAEWKKPDA